MFKKFYFAFLIGFVALCAVSCEADVHCCQSQGEYSRICDGSCPANTCNCGKSYCKCVGCYTDPNAPTELDKFFIYTGGHRCFLSKVHVIDGFTDEMISEIFEDNTYSLYQKDLEAFHGIQETSALCFPDLDRQEWWYIEPQRTQYVNGGEVTHQYIHRYTDINQPNNVKGRLSIKYRPIEEDFYAKKIAEIYHQEYKALEFQSMQTGAVGAETGSSNLRLTIATDEKGNPLGFEDGKLFFKTNKIYSTMSHKVAEPLLSDDVKARVLIGDYSVHSKQIRYNDISYNAIAIDGNLYIPFGNSYIYVGTTNENGLIQALSCLYFVFELDIDPTDFPDTYIKRLPS
ncbi:hypothetical protein AGMMS49982_11760 [Bacteroidia bacterium]|nr:hypothetical protein AGMMS49982_11760 [Bacteroidia bacterium]